VSWWLFASCMNTWEYEIKVFVQLKVFHDFNYKKNISKMMDMFKKKTYLIFHLYY
jgi:hypothetical protein